MALIHHTNHGIKFTKSDPLGGGLREEIEQEQRESAIVLGDEDGTQLSRSWEQIVADVEKDPDWFTFTNDDEAA